jgi:hypothetical protein
VEERADTKRLDEAWAAFCDRLKAAGERIQQEDFPNAPHERAEGYRHLGRLAVFALQQYLDFADPRFPAFLRFDDDVTKWGGPNADNHYLRARVEANGTYRITGNVRGLRELILSANEGDMQLGQLRVFEERNLSQLAVAADGALEVIVSAKPQAGNWLPLHPDAEYVLLRQYVSDWERDAVAHFRIERLGEEGSPPPVLEPARVIGAFARAATWVERSVVYWNQWMARTRGALPDNVLGRPRAQPGGAGDIHYGGGWWKLAEDEALLVECEPPDARYWSIQLYSFPWFESLDLSNRVSSLTGHQIRLDDDGRFRVVISQRDPGVQNWLDTEGRRAGLVTYRWVFSRTKPAPVSRVVKLTELREQLPETTPAFGPTDRREQIARRRAAVARRFRT